MKRGRKSKYTIELVRALCKLIKSGNSYKDSCFLVGITEETFCQWRRSKPEFSEQIRACDSSFKKVIISKISKQGEKDWRALAFLLERKYEEWRPISRNEFTGYIEGSEDAAETKKRKENIKKFLLSIYSDKSSNKKFENSVSYDTDEKKEDLKKQNTNNILELKRGEVENVSS